jgi:transposase
VNETSKSLGIEIESHWHTRNIQGYIALVYHVHLSRKAIHQMLHRMELFYTRPTYRLKKSNLKRKAIFQQNVEKIKLNLYLIILDKHQNMYSS